jgi:uncharacterized membrane protein
MHVAIWILIGLLVGAVAQRAGGRGAGRLAHIALGGLGAAALGWAVHLARAPGAPGWATHVGAALLGALGAVATARLLLRAAEAAPAAGPSSALEAQLLAELAHRAPVARDPNRAFEAQLTLGQRMADRIATFGGSWGFLGLFAALLLGWMIYNTERPASFDPYPFILLNLVLSCLAAVQAPVILMSQNRQAAKDRLDARLDYEVNLKAELEILALHAKLDGLRDKAWRELLVLQERQLALLERIDRREDRDE